MNAHSLRLGLGDDMDVEGAIDGAMDAAMDGAMALDDVDLFGDPVMGNALQLPPSRPSPSKQLQQRVDEMRGRGCCQSIAWSRQGTIALISRDGSLELRFLRSHPDSGTWELSEPTPCSNFTQNLAGGGLTHLAWASTGSPEVAVIDACGRICILSFSITLNRPYQIRKWDADAADDLHAVVGCYWLPLLPPSRSYNLVHGPALWSPEGGYYKYESSAVPASAPFHPNPAKSALLCVTTNGFLKMFFSQNNNKVEETTVELESVTCSDELITHASLCSDKNSLLIALATASRQLRVIRVTIRWGLPQTDKQQGPLGSMPLSPTLKETHIAVTSWLPYGPGEVASDMSLTQLSHVEMLPTALDTANQSWAPAIALTVRSHVPLDDSSYNQELQSVVDLWEVLTDQPQTLHPAFAQLGSRNGPASTPNTWNRLKKLDSIVMPKIIVGIYPIQLGRVICFAFSDGTMQYRDRLTMAEIYNKPDIDRIMSPHQVGFQFAEETPCLQVALSPTNCSFVQVCEDGCVKWNNMRYPTDDWDSLVQGRQQYAAVKAALSIATSSAAIHQTNCDDMLALARPFTQKNGFTYDWIREIVTMLKIQVDYSEESHHDQLVRNSHLQLCLSILNQLGFHGEFKPRSFGGKFAMLALNIRNIVILITIASNTPINLKEKLSPLDEPEVVDALAGCAKWALDLLSWLTDCLFVLLKDAKFMNMLADPKHFPQLANHLRSSNDVSLHLLLCSSTRGLLSAACRRLLQLDSLSGRAIQYYETKAKSRDNGNNDAADRPLPALYLAYRKMQRFTSSGLVRVSEFDRLIGLLGADIRSAYQSSLAGLVAKNGRSGGGGGGGGGGQQPQQASSQQQQQQQHHQNNHHHHPAGGGGGNNAGNDSTIKKAQAQVELDMLLAANPPPAFREVLSVFFNTHLRSFRNQTDPARLYFADYALLEVDDDARSLARKRAAGLYVDVFRRAHMSAGGRGPRSAGGGNGGGVGPVTSLYDGVDLRSGAGLAGAGATAATAAATATAAGATAATAAATAPAAAPAAATATSTATAAAATAAAATAAAAIIAVGDAGSGPAASGPQWRRCVRCASVMEDVYGQRPGFTFVLAQQRKCSCGGSWGLLPRESLVN